MTVINNNNTVRIWVTALLLSEVLLLVGKIEFMKEVVKMSSLPEKEVKE